ncbi:MAG: ROK family protein [Chthonomonadales bacterium]
MATDTRGSARSGLNVEEQTMTIRPNSNAPFVVGVDLGGTNVRAAVVGKDDKIAGQARNPSRAREGAAKVIEQVATTVRQAAAAAGVTMQDIGAIGMAVPGHIDTRTGIIIWSPNFGETVDGAFQIFLDVPFTGPLSGELGVACYAGNDANVAALGEFRYGAGRGVMDLVMLTLGTGIGSGVVSHGRLITGHTGGAVEFGHQVIVAGGAQCGCGDFGHLEAYCGRDAIVERALRAIESGKPTLLATLCPPEKTQLTPKLIDEAAQQGDAAALAVFEETGYYLGIGIANAVNAFNPEVVVLGGGIRKATGLLAAAERSMRAHAIASLARTCRLVEAELGEDAGVMGAAELAWREMANASS